MPPRDVTITLDTTAQLNPICPRFAENAEEVVRAAFQEIKETSEIVKASFVGVDPQEHNCAGNHNGLIMTVLEAYNNRRHLVLSPDDIKVAVLTQLGALQWEPWDLPRASEIHFEDTIHPDNYGTVAATVISKLPKDSHPYDTKALLTRVLERPTNPPRLSEPLTDLDYLFRAGSIPSVTLLGEKSDWEKLSQYFQTLRNEYARRTHYESLAEYLWDLIKLSEYFVKSFDNHEDKDVILFWNRMCPEKGRKGWLAAFSRWDKHGRARPEGLSTYGDADTRYLDIYAGDLYQSRVVPGYRSLEFQVNDGEPFNKLVTFAVGSVGTHFSSSKPNGHPLDTVQPMSGYFIYKW